MAQIMQPSLGDPGHAAELLEAPYVVARVEWLAAGLVSTQSPSAQDAAVARSAAWASACARSSAAREPGMARVRLPAAGCRLRL